MARTTAKPAAGKPVTLLEKYKDFGGIRAIERRLQAPENDPGTVAIRLKDEGDYLSDPMGKKRKWRLRWVNTATEGRWSNVIDVKGYEPVRVSELRDVGSITGLHKLADDGADPIVRRGDRGQEVLVKMPAELYTHIKLEQQKARSRRSRNAKLVKEDLANAAGKALGSEAGDSVYGDEFSVEVKQRRSTLQEELGDVETA